LTTLTAAHRQVTGIVPCWYKQPGGKLIMIK
jgi:hypothetical protein